MNSFAAPEPEEMGTSNTNGLPAQARFAHVAVDDLGISVHASLRIRGVVKEVADLFELTPIDEHADLLEKVIVIGATTTVTTAEISAADAARVKLERVGRSSDGGARTGA